MSTRTKPAPLAISVVARDASSTIEVYKNHALGNPWASSREPSEAQVAQWIKERFKQACVEGSPQRKAVAHILGLAQQGPVTIIMYAPAEALQLQKMIAFLAVGNEKFPAVTPSVASSEAEEPTEALPF